MGSLANHQSNSLVKMLLIGDAKTGKTGSLVSLVKVGYKLRILDYDNLLDPLKYFIIKECPDKLDNVEFRSLRDKYKATASGPVIDGQPRAYIDGLKMLDHWKYGDVDLGIPEQWGPDTIVVIDSLSRLSDAAFDFREPLTVRGKSGEYDGRATFYDAQKAIDSTIALLTSKNFLTNVIVIAHVKYIKLPDGSTKGFPQSVGKALSPQIPQYFPSVVLYTNKPGKGRVMQTNSTPMIDLANPAPFEMQPEYPIETGLAEFFYKLKGSHPNEVEQPYGKSPLVTALPEMKAEIENDRQRMQLRRKV